MARKNPSHLTNYMIRGKIMSDLISNVISLDLWHHNTMIFLTCQVVLYNFLQNFFIFFLLSVNRPKLIRFLRFLSICYTNIDICLYRILHILTIVKIFQRILRSKLPRDRAVRRRRDNLAQVFFAHVARGKNPLDARLHFIVGNYITLVVFFDF